MATAPAPLQISNPTAIPGLTSESGTNGAGTTTQSGAPVGFGGTATNAPGSGVTGVLGASTSVPTVDPNIAKIASLITSGTNAAVAGGAGSASQAAGNLAGLGNSLATTVGTGQNSIDEARKNIGLTQINSIRSLMDTIHQGLQGTGVQLGNSNALDSSASGAAARAYSNYGNVQENAINNNAATGNADQDVAQKNLDLTSTNGMATIKAARDSAIGSIQAQASQALQGLATTIAYMGGDASKIDVEAIKQQIVQNAQDQLAGVDKNISDLLSGIHPATADQTATSAESASNAGVVPSGATPFQLADPTQAPADTLGGADNSLIPLALKPRTATA